MLELDILEKIERCAIKAGMQYQMDVALDPDEDGNVYFADGYLFIDGKKTKFRAEDIVEIKFKALDEDEDGSYVKIKTIYGSLYVRDSSILKEQFIYQFCESGNICKYGFETIEFNI